MFALTAQISAPTGRAPARVPVRRVRASAVPGRRLCVCVAAERQAVRKVRSRISLLFSQLLYQSAQTSSVRAHAVRTCTGGYRIRPGDGGEPRPRLRLPWGGGRGPGRYRHCDAPPGPARPGGDREHRGGQRAPTQRAASPRLRRPFWRSLFLPSLPSPLPLCCHRRATSLWPLPLSKIPLIPTLPPRPSALPRAA